MAASTLAFCSLRHRLRPLRRGARFLDIDRRREQLRKRRIEDRRALEGRVYQPHRIGEMLRRRGRARPRIRSAIDRQHRVDGAFQLRLVIPRGRFQLLLRVGVIVDRLQRRPDIVEERAHRFRCRMPAPPASRRSHRPAGRDNRRAGPRPRCSAWCNRDSGRRTRSPCAPHSRPRSRRSRP